MRNLIKGIIVGGISVFIIFVGAGIYSESINNTTSSGINVDNVTSIQNKTPLKPDANTIFPRYLSNETHTKITSCPEDFQGLPNGTCVYDGISNKRPYSNLSRFERMMQAFPTTLYHYSPETGKTTNTTYHGNLENVVLEDINSYRTQYDLAPLSAGNAISPNLYAEELLIEGCIHHVDSKGQGPMLRYQTNGDTMFLVSENIAYESNPNIYPSDEIKDLNYQMMYNDSAENWSHRTNMLDPNATSVSIGIAYNSDSGIIVIVEDFQAVLQSGYQYDPSNFQTQPQDKKECW